MENEPDKLPPSGPPPPDLSSPPPPSMPPPPDIPPPPPPGSIPTVAETSPPRPVESSDPPAKPVVDGDEDDEEVVVSGADAPFETRVIAALIDCFIAGGLYAVLAIISSPVGFLVYLAYMLAKDALPFLDGHSLGKRIMKIRAVTLDGKKLSGDWQSSIMRNLPMIIPFFGFVELYVLFTRKDKGAPLRRLGDEWGKTKVVLVKEPSAI